MAACADIKFEIDKISRTDSDSSSYHNVTHSENNQNNLPKNSFFRLDPNWGKRKLCLTLSRKSSTQFSNITIADECAVH